MTDPVATVRKAQDYLYRIYGGLGVGRSMADSLDTVVAELERQAQEIEDMKLRLGDPRDVPVDTGNPGIDRVLSRLASADPDFSGIQDAAVLLRRLAADAKGPDGYETWKDAAIAERARAASQAQEIAALRAKVDGLTSAQERLFYTGDSE